MEPIHRFLAATGTVGPAPSLALSVLAIICVCPFHATFGQPALIRTVAGGNPAD